MYKEITQKILDLLRANATLKKEIRDWYFGTRKPAWTSWPFIWVKWLGGPRVRNMGGTKTYAHDYEIMLVDSRATEEETEQSAMAYAEIIEATLDADHRLGGYLDDTSDILRIDSDDLIEKGRLMVAARILFRADKTVS